MQIRLLLLVILFPPLMLQHAHLNQISILPVMPKHIPLPRLDHEAELLIQPKSVLVPGKCADSYAVHVGSFETPSQGPLDRFATVTFALVFFQDVDAKLACMCGQRKIVLEVLKGRSAYSVCGARS